MAVGQRCEVQPGGRRGVVEYVGEVEGLQVGRCLLFRFLVCPCGKNRYQELFLSSTKSARLTRSILPECLESWMKRSIIFQLLAAL